MSETYNVFQFFADGSQEQVRERCDAQEAVVAAHHYCTSVGARMGFTRRVIITDSGDCCCFEWKWDEGITFGSDPKHLGKLKNGATS